METFVKIIDSLNNVLWGVPTLVLLMGTAIYFSLRLGFVQFKYFGTGLKLLFRSDDGKGEISPFQSLCVALSACIGTGNIVGVAIAVTTGGVGALVWMFIAAVLGMATMYAEATMAIKYRRVDKNGIVTGGPFYYIEKGAKIKVLAIFFAVSTMCASALGVGSLSQIGSIVSSVNGLTASSASVNVFGNNISYIAIGVGIACAITAGMFILGGIKSIANVSSKFVPFMGGLYLIGGGIVIITHITGVPGAIVEMIKSAFSFKAVAGGMTGTAIMLAMQKGIARGVFSNEAGLGSNPIVAAAAKCEIPSEQGFVSMLGVFIDTCLVCMTTGLVIILTGANDPSLGLTGVAVTNYAFVEGLSFAPWLGSFIVNGSLMLFAYTTILGWCYYGERSCAYLFGEKSVIGFKVFYICALFIGIFVELTLIIKIADVFNAAMAIPNLIGLLLISNVVVKEKKDYEKRVANRK